MGLLDLDLLKGEVKHLIEDRKHKIFIDIRGLLCRSASVTFIGDRYPFRQAQFFIW